MGLQGGYKSFRPKIDLKVRAPPTVSLLLLQRQAYFQPNTSRDASCVGLNRTLIKCLTLSRGQTRENRNTCCKWHGGSSLKMLHHQQIIGVSKCHAAAKGTMNYWETILAWAADFYVMSGSSVTPRKVKLEIIINLLQRVAKPFFPHVRSYFLSLVYINEMA